MGERVSWYRVIKKILYKGESHIWQAGQGRTNVESIYLENGTIDNDIAFERINETVYAEEIAEETENEWIRVEEEKPHELLILTPTYKNI